MTKMSGTFLNSGACDAGPQGEGKGSPSNADPMHTASSGKYLPYPEYKDSEITRLGRIPRHWTIKKLKQIASIENGKDYKHVESEGGYPVIGSGGQFSFACQYLYNGESVLLGRKGTIDRPIYINGPFWTIDTMYYTKINKKIPAKYLYFATLTIEFNIYSTNTALPSMTQEDLGNIHFAIPSNDELITISAFLDYETARIDQLIAKQQQLIELLKEKRQAVISHAVTKGLNPNAPMKDSGVEWLGQVPEHWVVCKIKNLASIISKGTTPSTIGAEFIDKGVRFLKAENIGKSPEVSSEPAFFISEETNRQMSRSQLKENDVLVIIAGATTGVASIIQKELLPANTNQAVSFIRPTNHIFSKWILCWLATNFTQRVIWMGAVQAAQPNLSMESLGNIPITLPPEGEIQDIISTMNFKINKFEQLTNKAEETIRLMQERRTALISAAVTGKIDLRGWQAPKSEVAA